jgi:hypothetical protein
MKKLLGFVLILSCISIKTGFQQLDNPLTGIALPAPGYRESDDSLRNKNIGRINPNTPFLTRSQQERIAEEELQFKADAKLVNMPHNMQGRINVEPVILAGSQRNAMYNQKPVGYMEKPTKTALGSTAFVGQTGIYNRDPVFRPEGLPLR